MPTVAGDHVARPGLGAAHDDVGPADRHPTPPLSFPRAFVPVTSVPIRLPCTNVLMPGGHEALT